MPRRRLGLHRWQADNGSADRKRVRSSQKYGHIETLIDRQNHHFAVPANLRHQNSGDVRFRPRVVAFIVGQDFLNALGDFHIVVI